MGGAGHRDATEVSVTRAAVISLAMLTAVPHADAEPLTEAQRQRIQRLLAPDGARWAITRPANPVVDGAVICRDLATVDLMVHLMTEARTDRWASAATQGKIDRVRPPAREPDLAAYGCTFLPSGTRVLVEQTSPVPFVSAHLRDIEIRGVASPVSIEFAPLGVRR